jgi:tetratricopeptide (TPR) repeat protein
MRFDMAEPSFRSKGQFQRWNVEESTTVARQSNTHVDSAVGIARRLRASRRAAGLRQRDLAFERCSAGYISRIEKGDRIPSLQVIRELARRVGVSEAWLARGVDEAVEDSVAGLPDALLAVRLGELDEARAIVATVMSSNPLSRDRAVAELILGQAAFAEDDAPTAIEHFEQALELDQSLRDDPATADSLGRAYARVGETESAIALFRGTLDRAVANGDPLEELRFAVLLANALIDSSGLAEATSLLSAVVAKQDELDPISLARVYWTQSRLHAMKREPGPARRFARRALDLLEQTESLQYRSRAHQLLAFVELDAGNAEEALRLIRRARELALDSGTGYDEAKLAMEEARALVLLGHYEEAASLAMQAGAAFGDAHPWDLGRSYGELAHAFDEAGEVARALEMYELAIETLERVPNRYLAEAYARFGTLLEREGRDADAFQIYKRGAQLAAELERLSTRI